MDHDEMRETIQRLQRRLREAHEEIALWKDRYESLLRDAQEMERSYDKALNEGP